MCVLAAVSIQSNLLKRLPKRSKHHGVLSMSIHILKDKIKQIKTLKDKKKQVNTQNLRKDIGKSY